MRRVPVVLAVVTAASLVSACLGSERAVPLPSTTSVATTSTTAAPTTTAAPSTTAAPTSSTSTTLVWQQFPSGPVNGLRANSITTVSRVNTTDPVVFLTIDDGFTRDPRVPQILAEHQAPATLFLVSGSLAQDPEYFQQFLDIGGSINSHTLRHAHLPGMSVADQQAEICGMSNQIRNTYGSAGYFFRPPRGEYDGNTYRAAQACGARAIVLWRVTVVKDVIDTWGTQPINAGDIIILHFLHSTYDSLVVLFAELDRLGLKVARLEDYLPAL